MAIETIISILCVIVAAMFSYMIGYAVGYKDSSEWWRKELSKKITFKKNKIDMEV